MPWLSSVTIAFFLQFHSLHSESLSKRLSECVNWLVLIDFDYAVHFYVDVELEFEGDESFGDDIFLRIDNYPFDVLFHIFERC